MIFRKMIGNLAYFILINASVFACIRAQEFFVFEETSATPGTTVTTPPTTESTVSRASTTTTTPSQINNNTTTSASNESTTSPPETNSQRMSNMVMKSVATFNTVERNDNSSNAAYSRAINVDAQRRQNTTVDLGIQSSKLSRDRDDDNTLHISAKGTVNRSKNNTGNDVSYSLDTKSTRKSSNVTSNVVIVIDSTGTQNWYPNINPEAAFKELIASMGNAIKGMLTNAQKNMEQVGSANTTVQ